MAGKRRAFGAVFEAKVALAAAKGDRTTAQLASQFGIHRTTDESTSPANGIASVLGRNL